MSIGFQPQRGEEAYPQLDSEVVLVWGLMEFGEIAPQTKYNQVQRMDDETVSNS